MPAILTPRPIQLVVPALRAWLSPVGQLVPFQPNGAQKVIGQEVFVGQVVGVRMAGGVAGQRGTGFDRQAVRTYMARRRVELPGLP